MGFPAWEGARRCTSGPQPGAQAFMRWAMEEFGDQGAYNLGIFNCRTVRGGATTSMHGEGRACDVGFPVGDPDGNELLRRLLKFVGRLGIQCIIYERRIYSQKSPRGRYYGGVAPHYDHLHIEFTREAAQKLTYKTIKRVLGPRRRRRPGTRNLRRGMKGADVKFVQRKLDLKTDGIYGPNTARAVRQYERRTRRKYPRMKVDGTVGKLTWHTWGVRVRY